MFAYTNLIHGRRECIIQILTRIEVTVDALHYADTLRCGVTERYRAIIGIGMENRPRAALVG